MKTVQMTLDEELILRVDNYVKSHKTTRSAFARLALESELMRQRERELEVRQIEGYAKSPVKNAEFSDWESEQVWGE
jgi:metal-responsive CopG/Arc/MetJ family transcriptional regulator